MKKVVLTPQGVRQILSGRLWLTQKEVQGRPGLQPGELATVWSPQGHPLGTAYFNPKSRIFGRLLSRRLEEITRDFFAVRFAQALKQRQAFYPGETCLRLIHGEGDFLPGLTIDLYAGVAVIQITTAGMERFKSEILAALKEVLALKGVVFKNDLEVRKEEGLSLYVEDHGVREPFWVVIDDLKFLIDPFSGQKTGFFLDQRENRRYLSRYVKGKVVLDLFCYTGAFALYAAAFGAQRVVAVDRSEKALAWAAENARQNALQHQITFIQDDVEHFLSHWTGAEVVILDPPAFIKHRRHQKAGKRRYLSLNRRALKRLPPGGVLYTSSCSQALALTELQEIVYQAAVRNGQRLRLLSIGIQALDHPVLISMPETLYLKGLWLQRLEEATKDFVGINLKKG